MAASVENKIIVPALKEANLRSFKLLKGRQVSRTICLAFLLIVSVGFAQTIMLAPVRAASRVEDARAFYERFIAAQNAHDAATVESMLWRSPNFLWISRGKSVRGADEAMETYRGYYKGTWQVESDMAHFEARELPNGTVQVLVPITFLRGEPGQPAQSATYLISQTLFVDSGGWHIATIIPVADTKLH
ncbi:MULTISPECIES: nuclear transport factor 2 family protein [unclassified Bradyrhizobium]|uniref:nuclear transport factor 2 family protein n=1 Tax=unclassified Bradyrhizobium TaxID=2631580 RepID=UPI001FF82198|nr:nuclear transport factor 2 family protein [Bradyrhizobium sp. 48]MCK1446717.1 nuclear transport factor 2 family protein [Bradyrhizobium sp. 48]